MLPLPLHIYFEIAAMITALFFWRSLLQTRLRWFLPFLILIVGVELSARYLSYELKQPNAWLFSLSVPGEYCFYSFLFYLSYTTALFRKLAIGFIIAMATYSVYSMLFITGLRFFDMNILVAGSFAMILFCVLFFVDLYNSNDLNPIYSNPMFWICTGILFFNAGEFCYNLLSLLTIDAGFDRTLKVFRSINNSLILLLYTGFIIGFICQKISGTYRRV